MIDIARTMKTTMPRPQKDSAGDFGFCSRPDYFRQLRRDVAQTKAGDRVAVATMAFDPSKPLAAALMESLNAAARRGVDTSLSVDAFSFLFNEHTFGAGPAVVQTPEVGAAAGTIRQPARSFRKVPRGWWTIRHQQSPSTQVYPATGWAFAHQDGHRQ
jgi:hypothetical protein